MMKESGFSLLETVFTLAIFSIVMLTVGMAFSSSMRLYNNQDTKSYIESEARMALEQITYELRSSGFNGSYPHIYLPESPAPIFSQHEHSPANHNVPASHSAYGTANSIIFRLPFDNDNDGKITASDTGDIEWGADQISYVLVTNSAGVNELQRRVNADVNTAKILASHVEWIKFESHDEDPTLMRDQIKITIMMWKNTMVDDLYVSRTAVVNLRNSLMEE